MPICARSSLVRGSVFGAEGAQLVWEGEMDQVEVGGLRIGYERAGDRSAALLDESNGLVRFNE